MATMVTECVTDLGPIPASLSIDAVGFPAQGHHSVPTLAHNRDRDGHCAVLPQVFDPSPSKGTKSALHATQAGAR